MNTREDLALRDLAIAHGWTPYVRGSERAPDGTPAAPLNFRRGRRFIWRGGSGKWRTAVSHCGEFTQHADVDDLKTELEKPYEKCRPFPY